MGKYLFVLLLVFFLLFVVSCSNGGKDVVTPSIEERAVVAGETGTLACLGFWQVTIDENENALITSLRNADLIVNVLGFLEPPALTGLKIKPGTLDIDFAAGTVAADVVLTHPLNVGRYRGFDVRGVVFGPRVVNADGLTVFTSPEFFTGVPFGYIDGMLGTPDSSANYEGLAGYKYFCDGLGQDDNLAVFMSDPGNVANRGVFSHGNSLTRHYDLAWGDVPYDFMVFNYAVYANYDNPVGPPPITIDSFPIATANSQEAFCYTVTELANTLTYDTGSGVGSGSIDLQVEVWDWQGNISDVGVGLFESMPPPVEIFLTFIGPGATPYSYIYEVNGYSPEINAIGDLDLLLWVNDAMTVGESWYKGLLPPSNDVYNEQIFSAFVHRTSVEEYVGPITLPYEDPMDTTTEDLWSVHKYFGDHQAPNADWYQEGTQWVCNYQTTGQYENLMFTFLVSPPIEVPASGAMHVQVTMKYDTEDGYDGLIIGADMVGDGNNWWYLTDGEGVSNSDDFMGQSSGYPGSYITYDGYLYKGVIPGQIARLGFIFYADDSDCAFAGPFIDHLLLDEVFPQLPPYVGPVLGEVSPANPSVETYSVDAVDPNDDNIIYEWEIGDDDPAAYDDGPGNGDGTIDINWTVEGVYLVDCRVTDDGVPPKNGTSNKPLLVGVFNLPPNPGPTEDFEGAWPYAGWTFNDHTVAGTGHFWGKTDVSGTNCLDADGADDTCYGYDLFQEARWENVVVPNSSAAVLKITHTMWAEGSLTYMYFYDGGMLFIDDTLITDADFLSGVPNQFPHGSDFFWTENTYLPTWPGDTTNYGWSWKFPDPAQWLNGFGDTYVDISAYADGNPHDFSFIFHSDELYSCEDGDGWHSWLIDEVAIFYE